MTVVSRCWPGETVVLLGSGPSLTLEDVASVRGRARVIAINTTYLLAPWADALYACDSKWWTWHEGAPSFRGPKYSIDKPAARWPDVQVLQNTGPYGLELAPTGLRTGKNSGYQAINLAVHFGAARILLLGYDMAAAPSGRTHWHGAHPDHQPSPYPQMIAAFDGLVAPLAELGIRVVNCSRQTALTTFPRAALAEALVADTVATG
jgi:hypothetical protein